MPTILDRKELKEKRGSPRSVFRAIKRGLALIIMPYRNKTQESFCEFTVRDRGIAEHPTLTIEVETSFCQAFNDQLKTGLRHAAERAWDPDGVRWRIHPSALQKATAIALRNFKNVYLVEGEKVSDLINDTSFENLNLFK